MLKAYWLAQSLLTRLPVPRLDAVQAPDLARAALFYPLVGGLIGGILCLPMLLFPDASPLVLAASVTVLWAMVTGGLHLDGLADSADAWLGGFGDLDKTHRILKDPLVGAAGVIALVGVLLLKFAALSVLLGRGQWPALLLAPLAGRALILLLFLTTPYVRSGGLASAVTGHLNWRVAWWVAGSCLLLAVCYSWRATGALLAGFWAVRRLMVQRIHGCTGDTAGATVEIGEMLWLLAL